MNLRPLPPPGLESARKPRFAAAVEPSRPAPLARSRTQQLAVTRHDSSAQYSAMGVHNRTIGRSGS